MVMKTPAISGEVAARMSLEQVRLADGQTKASEAYQKMLLRQWCIEQAIQSCRADGCIYSVHKTVEDGSTMKSAVVPIAEEILRFITSL